MTICTDRYGNCEEDNCRCNKPEFSADVELGKELLPTGTKHREYEGEVKADNDKETKLGI